MLPHATAHTQLCGLGIPSYLAITLHRFITRLNKLTLHPLHAATAPPPPTGLLCHPTSPCLFTLHLRRWIHEYQLTPHSLYAAVSIGLECETILAVLNRLSKNVLPADIRRFVRACTQNYGKVGAWRTNCQLCWMPMRGAALLLHPGDWCVHVYTRQCVSMLASCMAGSQAGRLHPPLTPLVHPPSSRKRWCCSRLAPVWWPACAPTAPLNATGYLSVCPAAALQVKLVLQQNRFFVESPHPDILRQLLRDPTIKGAGGRRAGLWLLLWPRCAVYCGRPCCLLCEPAVACSRGI